MNHACCDVINFKLSASYQVLYGSGGAGWGKVEGKGKRAVDGTTAAQGGA